MSDFRKRNLEAWDRCLSDLFHGAVPARCVWDSPRAIAIVLKAIAAPGLNHVFLPGSGGLDLTGAKLSGSEDQCLELDLGRPVVVLPATLTFERLTRRTDWSYFWLEAGRLRSARESEDDQSTGLVQPDPVSEDMWEVRPGVYLPLEYEPPDHDDDEDERALTSPARLVTRYLRGSFVLTAKACGYNSSDAYDALHEKLGPTEFKKQMARLAKAALENEARTVFPVRLIKGEP